MNDLVFLYKRAFNHGMEGGINAVCVDKKMNVPVVMTHEEAAPVLSLMNGTAQLVAKVLYGRDLRIMEAVRLRVQDIDFQIGKRERAHDFARGVPLLVTIEDLLPAERERDEIEEELRGIIRAYRSTLQTDRRHLLENFSYVHTARKLVGAWKLVA